MKAENGLKKCSKCGEVKGVEEYSKDVHRKDGLHNTCRKCRSEYRLLFKNENPALHSEHKLARKRKAKNLLYKSYIVEKIRQSFPIKASDIPPIMIELKRTQLINKRLIKNLKENETE